jgi:hypothetical protein
MADTTDTDDLTPAGEGTPLGEAEPSREWKDERIKELGGYTPEEMEEMVDALREIGSEVEADRPAAFLSELAFGIEDVLSDRK